MACYVCRGTVYMGVTTDVTRGCIGVGGGPFGVLVCECLIVPCAISFLLNVMYALEAMQGYRLCLKV